MLFTFAQLSEGFLPKKNGVRICGDSLSPELGRKKHRVCRRNLKHMLRQNSIFLGGKNIGALKIPGVEVPQELARTGNSLPFKSQSNIEQLGTNMTTLKPSNAPTT